VGFERIAAIKNGRESKEGKRKRKKEIRVSGTKF
jgi:hypothetical protein